MCYVRVVLQCAANGTCLYPCVPESDAPAIWISQAWSTHLMNYITADGICVLHPNLTFSLLTIVNPAWLDAEGTPVPCVAALIERYDERNFSFFIRCTAIPVGIYPAFVLPWTPPSIQLESAALRAQPPSVLPSTVMTSASASTLLLRRLYPNRTGPSAIQLVRRRSQLQLCVTRRPPLVDPLRAVDLPSRQPTCATRFPSLQVQQRCVRWCKARAGHLH